MNLSLAHNRIVTSFYIPIPVPFFKKYICGKMLIYNEQFVFPVLSMRSSVGMSLVLGGLFARGKTAPQRWFKI